MPFDTLVAALARRAEHTPDRLAYAFHTGDTAQELTCAEVLGAAGAVATRLREAGLRPGDRALLLFEPGLAFVAGFFGCAWAGVVAVPAYPPDPARLDTSLSRLRAVATDAAPRALVASVTVAAVAPAVLSATELADLPLIPVDGRPGPVPAPADVRPEDLVFLQYTSGTTRSPRGVRVDHRALLHNQRVITLAFGQTPDSVGVGWLPTYHDMGLVGNVVNPWTVGFPVHLLSPLEFLKDPGSWLRLITRVRGTVSGGPNFAYDLCARKVGAEAKLGLELSSWALAFSGAELVRPATLDRFAAAFAPSGFRAEAFYPCYGLAEGTLMATGGRRGVVRRLVVDGPSLEQGRAVPAPAGRELVSCGRPVLQGDECCVVVDGERAADGVVGEVWLRGGSIAAGYHSGDPGSVFGGLLAGDARPWLRTGDLGFWWGGELYVTGRQKDALIVRGRNLAPTELEALAEVDPRVRPGCTAAVAVDDGGEERVALVAEVAAAASTAGIAQGIAARLAAGVGITPARVVLLPPGALPKTSSGKLQRSVVRAALAPGAAPPPWLRPLGDERDEDRAGDRIRWVREWAGRRADPRAWDERRCLPPHVVSDLGRAGLFGLAIDREHGGSGLGAVDVARVVAAVAGIDLTLATFVGAGTSLGGRAVARHGTAAQRERWLPLLASGRALSAFAASEAGAGSHLGGLRTRADRVDGGWALTGEKAWIGNAAWAEVLVVLARTAEGVTAFVVPTATPGVELGDEVPTLGLRAMAQSAVRFHGAVVPDDAVLGPLGRGLEVAADTFRVARLGVAALAVGGIRAALALGHRYAQRRRLAGGLLWEHDAARARLEGLADDADGLERLIAALGPHVDDPLAAPDDLFAAAKVLGSERLWAAADTLVQLLGARGYSEGDPAARLLRDARVARIFEGPTEALAAHLGARWLAAGELSPLLGARAAPALPPDLLPRAREVGDRPTGAGREALGHVAVAASVHAVLGDAWSQGLLERALASFSPRSGPSAGALDARIRALGSWAPPVRDRGLASGGDPLLAATPSAAPPIEPPPAAQPRGVLADLLAAQLGVARVDPGRSAAELGLDSLSLAELAGRLERATGRRVDPAGAWSHPSLDAWWASVGAGAPAPRSTEQASVLDAPEVKALESQVRELGDHNPFFRTVDPRAGQLRFTSYDYLGLATDPRVVDAAASALRRLGTGVSASRAAGGDRALHRELEQAVASFLGCDDSLAMVSGHATNVGAVAALVGPPDAVAHDVLAHNSIVEGVRLSGARQLPFPHDDPAALDELLRSIRPKVRRVLVAVEGVYSADGDVCSLGSLVEVARRHRAMLLVDEAHSIGVLGETGRGVGEHLGVPRGEVDVWMGTFSKALASCGGYLAGRRELVDWLRHTTGGFVYSAGMTPANAAAALAALQVLRAEPERVATLRERAARFRALCRAAGLDVGRSSDSAVVPVLTGSATLATAASAALRGADVEVVPMIPPAVEDGASRLRFFVRVDHTERELAFAAERTAAVLRDARG